MQISHTDDDRVKINHMMRRILISTLILFFRKDREPSTGLELYPEVLRGAVTHEHAGGGGRGL